VKLLNGAYIALAIVLALFADNEALLVLGFGVTHLMYYRALEGQWNGLANSVFDRDTDTINTSIHTNTYAPNQDTHDFFDDVTNEVTGTNYSAGGSAITGKTISRTTGTVTFDGNDIVWTQSGAGFSNGRKFVIRRITGSAATERLYSVITADSDVGNVTGDLTLAFNAAGIATWSTT